MGKIQRDRGASTEREVAKLMEAALGVPAKRRLGQAREGGHDIDIDLPLVVEVKRRKRPMEALRWLQQADSSEKEGTPIVVTRGDSCPFLVVQYFSDWLELYRAALDGEEDFPSSEIKEE